MHDYTIAPPLLQPHHISPPLPPSSQTAYVELGLRPGSPQEEAALIQAMHMDYSSSCTGDVGDSWHVLPFSWWQAWVAYSGFGAQGDSGRARPDRRVQAPGRIDTTPLLRSEWSTYLKVGIHPNHDYKLLPPRVATALEGWYGTVNYSSLVRKVIAATGPAPRAAGGRGGRGAGGGAGAGAGSGSRGGSKGKGSSEETHPEVELYPPALSIRRLDAEGELRKGSRGITFSRVTSLQTVRDRCAKDVMAEPEKARLWARAPDEDTWVPVSNLKATLEDAEVIATALWVESHTRPSSHTEHTLVHTFVCAGCRWS